MPPKGPRTNRLRSNSIAKSGHPYPALVVAGSPGFGDPGNHADGTATSEVLKEFSGFPRLLPAEAVRKAVARGVETFLPGCATGRPQPGDHGHYLIDRSRIAFDRSETDEEIDQDSGFPIAHRLFPRNRRCPGEADTEQPGDRGEHPLSGEGSVVADQRNSHAPWNASANLADVAVTVPIHKAATDPEGCDKAESENGIPEHPRESGLLDDDRIPSEFPDTAQGIAS